MLQAFAVDTDTGIADRKFIPAEPLLSEGSSQALKVTVPPGGVNLQALLTRLSQIRCSCAVSPIQLQ